MDDIHRVYAQATLYSRGNFLRVHNDEAPSSGAARYVITDARWRPDWGAC